MENVYEDKKKYYQSYREKIKLGFDLLNIEQLQLDVLDRGLASNRSLRNTVVFSMDQTIEVHFKSNWKNMTGDPKFDNKFNTQGPSNPPTIGRFKAFKKRSRYFDPARYYKIFREEEGSKQEIRWPTMIREIDHDFGAVFEEDKQSKHSTNTSNMDETSKLLKM